MIIDDTYRLLQITYWATYSVEKNDVYSRFELERENNEPYESYYKVARLVNYLQPVSGSLHFTQAGDLLHTPPAVAAPFPCNGSRYGVSYFIVMVAILLERFEKAHSTIKN